MNPRPAASLLALALAAAVAGCASPSAPRPLALPGDPADCASDAAVAAQVATYLERRPLANPDAALSMPGAVCSARKFVAALGATQGRVVGYKAGLTTLAMQQRFGVSQPLRGTLLEKMVVRDGATVPAAFGALPFVESDLVVEVGSAAINDATTPMQALAALRAVRPFIELPDRLFADPTRLSAAALTVGNVGARLGVLGAPVPVRADAAFAESLRTMTVRLVDATGKESVGRGADILGDPLNAVLFLVADLRRAGIALQPGDWLSLGGFGVGAAQPGGSARVTYEGLPGNPSVSVNFR